MQNTKKILISLLIFLILVIPVLSFAQGLVPCDNVTSNCDFNALLTLVNNVIDFIFKFMAIPIAAIMFAYAGFELVTSGGSTEKRGIAKKVFMNALIGLVIAVAAFLIIKTILVVLGYKYVGLFFK